MPPQAADVAANLDSVRRRIAAAAHRVDRPASDITLVAVSKTFGPDLVRTAAAAGQLTFGENRVQEALAKQDALADLRLDWHLIGHLQANKARRAVTAFATIHSVDRPDLLARLDRAAAEAGVRPRILLQVDLAGEATKSGVPAAEVPALARAALATPHLLLAGLMIIPPAPDDAEASRPWFARLRELRDSLVREGLPAERLAELSMGMSTDFEVAVEEGATIVRVGSALFGARPPVADAARDRSGG